MSENAMESVVPEDLRGILTGGFLSKFSKGAQAVWSSLGAILPEEIPISVLIPEARKALDAGLDIAALNTALVIPDILGQRCFPDIKYSNGQRNVKRQYASWFDRWVREFFNAKNNDPNCPEWMKQAPDSQWFTGRMCYALRCKMLHAGKTDIDFSFDKEDDAEVDYVFALAKDGYGVQQRADIGDPAIARVYFVAFSPRDIVLAICSGAEACLKEYPD